MRRLTKDNAKKFMDFVSESVELFGRELTTFDGGKVSVGRIPGYRMLMSLRIQLFPDRKSRWEMTQQEREQEGHLLKDLWAVKHGVMFEEFIAHLETSVRDGLEQGWLSKDFIENIEATVRDDTKRSYWEEAVAELNKLPTDQYEREVANLQQEGFEKFILNIVKTDSSPKR